MDIYRPYTYVTEVKNHGHIISVQLKTRLGLNVGLKEVDVL